MTRQELQPSVRLLVLLLAVALVFLFVGRPADAEAPVETIEYVVAPGDTLWAIASDAGDGLDPRQVILVIQDLNDIEGGAIHPGQVLLVPAEG